MEGWHGRRFLSPFGDGRTNFVTSGGPWGGRTARTPRRAGGNLPGLLEQGGNGNEAPVDRIGRQPEPLQGEDPEEGV